MTKRSELITRVMQVVAQYVSPDKLDDIKQSVVAIISDYEVEKRNVELIPASSWVPDFYATYIAQKTVAGRSVETLKLYNYYLSDYFLNAPAPIEQMDTSLALQYLYCLKKRKNISNRTLDQARLICNGFFEWAVNEGYIQRNFFGNIDPIKYVAKPRQPLTDEECAILRDSCLTFRERAMLDVFISTGIRVSEMVNMKWEDIDMQNKKIHVFGKGSKHRTVLFDSQTKVSLLRYKMVRPGDSPYVFVAEKYPYNDMKKSAIEHSIKRLAERSGLSAHITPHVLRHTFGTNCLRKGMALEQIQKLLGHEEIRTTQIYAATDMDQVNISYRKIYGT